MGRSRKRTHSQMKHQNRNVLNITAAADDPPPDPDPDPNPNPNPSPPPTTGDPPPLDLASSSNFRNWADLAEPLLASIADRLFPSAPDLLAFSAACLPWRSAAAAASSARGPPLLLNPSLCFHHRRPVRWAGPARCRLQTLTLDDPARSYRSPLSPQTVTKSCVGSSHGQLLFSAGGRHAVLADAFTGRELRSPNFPSGSFRFSFGILTAPLSSPSCSVLLVALNVKLDVHSFLCWGPGSSSKWSELRLMHSPEITSLVVFKGEVFGLDALYRLIAVEFVPEMSCRLLEVQFSTAQFLYHHLYRNFGQHLVECDGELLAVLFVQMGNFCVPALPKIEVYQLNSTKSRWVKKESLGDWCLFIDAVGKCPFACRDPTRWGGRKNCVYVAGPGCDSWSVFPLDGEAIDMTDDESPLCSWYMALPKWPSPVWVYPSTLL